MIQLFEIQDIFSVTHSFDNRRTTYYNEEGIEWSFLLHRRNEFLGLVYGLVIKVTGSLICGLQRLFIPHCHLNNAPQVEKSNFCVSVSPLCLYFHRFKKRFFAFQWVFIHALFLIFIWWIKNVRGQRTNAK